MAIQQKLITSSLTKEKRKIAKGLLCQWLVVLLISLGAVLTNSASVGWAIFLGGATNLVPTALLVLIIFIAFTDSRQNAKLLGLTLGIGEFLKFLISGLTIGLLIIKMPDRMSPILIGFLSALLALWVSPLIIKVTGFSEDD